MSARPVIAIQGEFASFSEEACRQLTGGRGRVLANASFEAAVRRVLEGEADHVLLPWENSLVGPVAEAQAAAEAAGLVCCDEIELPVWLCLIGVERRPLTELDVVCSHPVALRQCGGFLFEHLWLRPVATEDTAGSVRDIVNRGAAKEAAIASRAAAVRYGGVVLREGIQDRHDNRTRFRLFAGVVSPAAQIGSRR
jgi:prephenate dehydratase